MRAGGGEVSTTSITPGSIKARILEAIIDLEEGATSSAIKKRHPANESLVNTSLDELFSGGYIEANCQGVWQLTVAAKKVIRGETITQALAAIRLQQDEIDSGPKPPPPAEPAPVAMRECVSCYGKKPVLTAFYGKDRTCKDCRCAEAKRRADERKERQRAAAFVKPPPALNGHYAAPSTPSSKQEPEPVATPPSPPLSIAPVTPASAEVVIPAPGSIKCRAENEVLLIMQYKQSIAVDREQLPGLIEWLSKQVLR